MKYIFTWRTFEMKDFIEEFLHKHLRWGYLETLEGIVVTDRTDAHLKQLIDESIKAKRKINFTSEHPGCYDIYFSSF